VRLRSLQAILLAILPFAGSCRCNDETLSPIVIGERSALSGGSDGPQTPPWDSPTQVALDNGLLVHWLHEQDSLAFNLRLLFPTTMRAESMDAAITHIAFRATERDLTRRLAPLGAHLTTSSAAGRMELSIQAPAEAAEAVLDRLAKSLGKGSPLRLLASEKGRAFSKIQRRSAAEVVSAHITSDLLDLPLSHQLIAPAQVKALDLEQLKDGWWALHDPRQVVAIIHTGRSAADLQKKLSQLADTWETRALLRGPIKSVFERLRAPIPAPNHVVSSPRGLLLSDPVPPIQVVPGAVSTGKHTTLLVLGRILPASTAPERAMARLAQRLLQERLDARLLISGSTAVLLVRIRISQSDPVGSVDKALKRLQAHASGDDPPERLRQAAQLWLGARIVDASLRGDDWTMAWSESIDLAQDKLALPTALAQDAQLLQEISPDDLGQWRKRWLDPSSGDPGWIWMLAGADVKTTDALATKFTLLRDPL